MRAARSAGWRRSDLWWERLQERANGNWLNGKHAFAQWQFRLAWCLSQLAFASDDARSTTSLANLAFCSRRRGGELLAQRQYRQVIEHWSQVPNQIDGMHILPRARSSLFHLRMEARHWDTFRNNTQTRIGLFVAESAECLQALSNAKLPPHRLYSRWAGEKPSVYDDTRKLLGACLLIASDS
jgi:hypothetical protein